jgi:hypothetical protein
VRETDWGVRGHGWLDSAHESPAAPPGVGVARAGAAARKAGAFEVGPALVPCPAPLAARARARGPAAAGFSKSRAARSGKPPGPLQGSCRASGRRWCGESDLPVATRISARADQKGQAAARRTQSRPRPPRPPRRCQGGPPGAAAAGSSAPRGSEARGGCPVADGVAPLASRPCCPAPRRGAGVRGAPGAARTPERLSGGRALSGEGVAGGATRGARGALAVAGGPPVMHGQKNGKGEGAAPRAGPGCVPGGGRSGAESDRGARVRAPPARGGGPPPPPPDQ